jgi:serine/threonine-protein kinase
VGAGARASGDLLRAGDVLDGVFEIRGLLGQGGMAQVFEAYDRTLHRIVAIKAAWPHAQSSLRSEALALAALNHPSVISIHSLGRYRGIDYVVMERIHGETLEAELERRRAEGVPMPIAEVVRTMFRIAVGLSVVHRAGIAHRDVKPANVMFAPGGRVVLTDFGIFRPEGSSSRDDRLMGSPAYMAPETITCAVALGQEYLVDIYALGIVAYEMLTGVVPFWHENTIAIFEQHLLVEPPDPSARRPDTPLRLALLVREMLAKDPGARPQTMEEIAWRLRRDAFKPRAAQAPLAPATGDTRATALACRRRTSRRA